MINKTLKENLAHILTDEKFALASSEQEGFGQAGQLLNGLTGDFVDLGNHYQSVVEKDVKDSSLPEAYFFHYEVVLQIKHLLLLLRDIEFQFYKAKNLQEEHRLSQDDFINYCKTSLNTIREARKELEDWYAKKWSIFKLEQEKLMSRWEKQSSPWKNYRFQFELIQTQSNRIQRNAERVNQLSHHFRDIRQLITNALRNLADRLDQIEINLSKFVDWFITSDLKSTNQIVNYDKNLSFKNASDDEQTPIFLELKQLIDLLQDKQTFIIDTRGGMLIELDIDLKKKSTVWLEGEIFPQIIELFELVSRANHSFAFCLTNIRNRALLTSEVKADAQTVSDCQLIAEEELVKIDAFQKELSRQTTILLGTMEESFQITNIYDKNLIFLPPSIQNTLRQLGVDRSRISQMLSNKIQSVTSRLQQVISSVEKEEEASTLQKVVRYIDQRQPDPKNHHYSSIFLSKGFVGASFAVGRTSEMDLIKDSLEKWDKGYRGSILLTGNRFCGKTFFGDWSATRLFPSKRLIRISPGVEMHYSGRKVSNTHNLSEVLNFIKKFALKDRPFIWIDDLELWQNEKNTLFENLDSLLKFVDLNSNRCLVMASICNWNLRHFNTQLEFKQSFQTIIDLSSIPTDEIYRAILIRHGATYRKMLSPDKQDMISRDYKQMINKIVKASSNNIGEAFQWWSSSVKYLNDKEVIGLPFEPYGFPIKLRDEQQLLLRQILLFRRIDEFMLSRQFGTAFGKKYTYHLRRMLNNGMLTRQSDGALEVTDCLANILGNHIFETRNT